MQKSLLASASNIHVLLFMKGKECRQLSNGQYSTSVRPGKWWGRGLRKVAEELQKTSFESIQNG